MSGHSKWAQIKRQKGAVDAKRGQLFSKLSRLITLAARSGAPTPEANPKLAVAIEKARKANAPKNIIERAIEKASQKDSSTLEEFFFEAYGPEGSALLIKGITDSTNRSSQEIKHSVSLGGGKFANPGTVSWMFEEKGIVEIASSENKTPLSEIELLAIDGGAENTERDDEHLAVFTSVLRLQEMKSFLKEKSVTIADVALTYVPTSVISISEKSRGVLETLTESLESRDDVQDVYTNVE